MKAALYEKHRSARQLMEDVFEQETTGKLLPQKKEVKKACATDLEHVKNRLTRFVSRRRCSSVATFVNGVDISQPAATRR